MMSTSLVPGPRLTPEVLAASPMSLEDFPQDQPSMPQLPKNHMMCITQTRCAEGKRFHRHLVFGAAFLKSGFRMSSSFLRQTRMIDSLKMSRRKAGCEFGLWPHSGAYEVRTAISP